jgi:hypothetical protein
LAAGREGLNSGPPINPSVYNNNVQIFQTPGTVVILNEMVHNARIERESAEFSLT